MALSYSKKFVCIIKRITGNNHGEFYCLNCFCAYTTENKLESHKKVCENHDCYCVEIPEEYNKILKYNHGEKSMKAPLMFMLIKSLCWKK